MDQMTSCPSTKPAVTPGWSQRLVAAMVATCTGLVLLTATFLTPAEAGVGTHTKLGLPACSWISRMDLPCPTCGYTTAFTYAAHGDFKGAFITQPFATLLAVATAVLFLGSMVVLLTGAPLGSVLARTWTTRWTWIAIGLLLLAWVYKILLFKELI